MAKLTVHEASRRLGVKPATLYAYVSRGVLRGERAPDGRSTLFESGDIERLARRGRPRRTSAQPSLEVVIETAITELTPTGVRYRNHPSAELAATATFEQVAELLWTGELGPHRSWPEAHVPLGLDVDGFERMRAVLAVAAWHDPLRIDLSTPAVIRRGRAITAALVDSLTEDTHVRAARLTLPGTAVGVGGTIAGRLWARLSAERPRPGALVALNAALVLLADHELAASTLAGRVAASTRADPYAVVGAALGVVSGPLHGGASRAARAMLDAAADVGAEAALAAALATHGTYPGFGHSLYRDGDPRAAVLLPHVRALAPAREREPIEALIEVARQRVGIHPNIDFALAALGHAAGLPAASGELVFAIARSVGWVAHALEEYGEARLRFRPRAVYVGPRG